MRLFNSLILISGGILLANISVLGQVVPGAFSYHEQALVFSNYEYIGTARIHGLGNTQISLGGDISSALSNPAGLGFYNRSEFTISPSFNQQRNESSYIGTNTTSTLGKFNFDNIGMVFNKTKGDNVPGKWRGGSFVISFSKVNEFNSDIRYQGLNPNNDILDFYVQDANIQNQDPANIVGVAKGAYNNYLMSEFLDAYISGGDTSYIPFYERTFFSEFPSGDYPTNQSETIQSSGSQNQWNFSYGGNFDDMFYFGATLGIQSIRANIVKEYREQYPGLQGDIVDNSFLYEELTTEGIGVNGSFGVIARPINQMTIGFSLITPTFLSMSERYRYNSQATFNNFSMTNYGDYFDANYDLIANENADFTTFYEFSALLNTESYEEESFFDYTITTPMRLNFGATYFIGKNGFISGDVELVNYSNMKLKGDGGLLDTENTTISELYTSTLNYRLGGEWRIDKMRLRLGYNIRGNPYSSDRNDISSQMVTGGIGYRSQKIYLDLATSYRAVDNIYAPYVLENPNNDPIFQTSYASMTNSNLNFMLTFGVLF